MFDFFFYLGLSIFLYFLIYVIIVCITGCDLSLAYAEKFGKPKESLKNQVIWITGASSGIGKHLALECAAIGCKIVLTARRENPLNDVKEECIGRGAKPENLYVLPFDLLNTESHQQKFDEVIKHFGQLNILVNNAGRSQRATWEDIDLEVDKQLFDLDVFSVVNLSRIAVKYFREQGSGHIAVTSSIGGLYAVPFSSSYIAAKHAIQGYFNSLIVEKVGTNLDVTLFCPGPTFTGYLEESFTGTNGKKYGISINANERRLTSEHCAHFFVVALANKLEVTWVCRFPYSILTYLSLNFSTLQKKIIRMMGVKRMHKLRGG